MDLSGIESIMLSIHMGLAAALKDPSFEITAEEAHKLTAAGAKVAAHYNVLVTQKQADLIELGKVAFNIYGPRLFVAALRPRNPAPAASPVAPQSNGAIIGAETDPSKGPGWGDFPPASFEVQ